MRTKNEIKIDLQDLKINTSGGRMKTKLEMNLTKLGKAGAQLLVLSFLVLSACTKTIPTEKADPIPDPVSSKSNLQGERLFSISMQNASMTSQDALPYSSSDNKRVKLEITKDSLRVVETEQDARYQTNKANDKIVLEIPVEHYQIECKKDKYGECTNTQAEATDIPWDQKQNIKIKFAEAKMAQLDFLPILVSQTYGEDCYEEISSRLVKADIDADSMNWDVERTFKNKIQCVTELEAVADATVTAVYHYSMVRLDKVLTPGFKTVSYPEGSKDEKTFGFFSTKRTVLAADNNKTDKTAVQIMNHWNPDRTKIDYYLSDEFNHPENKMIKDLTYQTVDNLNQGLKEAGVKFTIDLHEPAGKVPGDIRNSMIVLVEDPINSGVIGYGPQTEDPLTGEIISARTVMFLGTIKQGVGRTYEQIRLEIKQDAEKSLSLQKATAAAKYKLSAQMSNQVAAQKASGQVVGLTALQDALNKAIAANQPLVKTKSMKAAAAAAASLSPKPVAVSGLKVDANQIKQSIKNYTARTNPEIVGTDYLSKLKYLHQAKNCALVPAGGYTGGISPALKAQFSLESKPWDQLSDKEKQRVMNIILPQTWIATLIHEMGHNLGLRHNFAGSEDTANFLSIEELQAKGIDHSVPFSSVMDYGDDLKALPYLGKYDIAALKFGYLRQVSVDTSEPATANGPGKVVKSEVVQLADNETLQSKLPTLTSSVPNTTVGLKAYDYCTDEHVGINAGCKRFDLGTSYTEIVQNYIKDYEDLYALRNFRNGRANMSLMDDVTYAARIGATFRELRVMMEVRERIKYAYHLADDADEWEQVSFLKDLNRASLISGVFLAKVLLVPDQSCAIATKKDPNTIVQLVPLNMISQDSMSCFGLQLSNDYIVVAEAGKAINSKKDPESTNSYADQIDMRGIWGDKLMAAKYLFSRQIGIFTMDDKVDNFLNIDLLRSPIASAVSGLMTNTVVDKIDFRFADGSKQAIEVNYDLFDSQKINQLIHPVLSKRMGLPTDRAVQLQEIVGAKFASGMNDRSGEHEQDKPLSLAFLVKRYESMGEVLDNSVKTMDINGTLFVASPSNIVAAAAMDNFALTKKLEKIGSQKVLEIAQAKNTKQPMPTTATADEKLVWDMPLETLADYLSGTIKSSAFYASLLNVLPTSNY